MKKIVFSQTNIEKMIANNELTSEELLVQFERSDLISTARYVDSSGLPWGSWRNVAHMIDNFLLEQQWVFRKHNNHNVNLNVAYFAPSSFLKIGSLEILNFLQSCTVLQLNFVFTQPKILKFLAGLLTSGVSEIVLEKMEPEFFLSLLQAFTQDDYLKPEKECWLCNRFIQIKKLSVGDLYHTLLKSRILGVQAVETKLSKKSSYKVALLITGQLRGFETAIPRMEAKFAHLGKIDAYISTWDEVGYTRFNLQNAYRIFDKPTSDFIIEHKDDLDLGSFDKEIYEFTKQLYSLETLQSKLNGLLEWCESVKLNIKSYQEYPYNKMSNSEKMYYHNSYWVETLGSEHFEQYDIIIKIRPDYFFKELTPISVDALNDKNILADTNNYLVQEWGFGLGDQLWIGVPKTMIPLLTCHNKQSLSYQYMQDAYSKDPYQGHLNCGLQAWFTGLDIVSDNHQLAKSRLASTRLITFEEFIQMEIKNNSSSVN